jgi:hypothetical protein
VGHRQSSSPSINAAATRSTLASCRA